jgi:hypothetical protein
MTTRFRDFGTPTSEGLEPIVFKIYGREFTCVPEIQGKFILELVAASSSEDSATSANAIIKFISTVLTADSLVGFDELLESKDTIVSVEVLADISGWLMEQYSDRPNQQPEA